MALDAISRTARRFVAPRPSHPSISPQCCATSWLSLRPERVTTLMALPVIMPPKARRFCPVKDSAPVRKTVRTDTATAVLIEIATSTTVRASPPSRLDEVQMPKPSMTSSARKTYATFVIATLRTLARIASCKSARTRATAGSAHLGMLHARRSASVKVRHRARAKAVARRRDVLTPNSRTYCLSTPRRSSSSSMMLGSSLRKIGFGFSTGAPTVTGRWPHAGTFV